MPLTNINDIKHTYYINLEHRTDRKQHVEEQLTNIGITNATRFNAIKMENGAIGCSMSHLKLLQDAYKNNLDHILIVEDDITFLDPELFKAQLNKFLNSHTNWDVVLFAGNNFPPYKYVDETCIKVSSCQTTTGYLVNGHYIKVLLQNIKTGLTHLIHKPTEHTKFAIDKFWFILQRECEWFLIMPPTVVQYDDYSDIEKRHTNYTNVMLDINKSYLHKYI
jgi:glycosyl transferase family 25